MKLTYKNSHGDIEELGNFSSREEVFNAIDKRLNITDEFNSPYLRVVGLDDNRIMFDYGSYTSFFYVDTSFDEFMKQH